MSNKAEIFAKIQALATDCHQLACTLDVGNDRTEMFDVYGVLHNLTRPGYASEVCTAMNPLLSFAQEDEGWEEEDE